MSEDERTDEGGLEIPEPIARELLRAAPSHIGISAAETAGIPRASGTVSNYVRLDDGSQIDMGPSRTAVHSGQLVSQIENGIHYDLIIFRDTEDGDEKDEWKIYLGSRPMEGGLAIPPAHPWIHAPCKWCGQPQGYPVQILKNEQIQFDGCIVCMSWAAVGHR